MPYTPPPRDAIVLVCGGGYLPPPPNNIDLRLGTDGSSSATTLLCTDLGQSGSTQSLHTNIITTDGGNALSNSIPPFYSQDLGAVVDTASLSTYGNVAGILLTCQAGYTPPSATNIVLQLGDNGGADQTITVLDNATSADISLAINTSVQQTETGSGHEIVSFFSHQAIDIGSLVPASKIVVLGSDGGVGTDIVEQFDVLDWGADKGTGSNEVANFSREARDAGSLTVFSEVTTPGIDVGIGVDTVVTLQTTTVATDRSEVTDKGGLDAREKSSSDKGSAREEVYASLPQRFTSTHDMPLRLSSEVATMSQLLSYVLDPYLLLPEFYRYIDGAQGEPLRKFTEPLRDKLTDIYLDELDLRKIQDPDSCPTDFLFWIAQSLGWTYINSDPEQQRREVREILNMYDLKGTPYAMRLLARLCFGSLFKRLAEFYQGAKESISSIRTAYDRQDYWLRYMIEGNGVFAVQSWKETKIAERGRPYGFNSKKRFWSYLVEIIILPQEYEYGMVRPKVIKFIQNYHKFHPAGRFCYLYIHMPIAKPKDEQKGSDLIDELTGALHLDTFWKFDDGRYWDEGLGPVHPSISSLLVKQYDELDTGWEYDQGKHWDELHASAHVMIELD